MKITSDSKPLDLERAREKFFMRLKLECGALSCARCGFKGEGVLPEPSLDDPTRPIALCRLCENARRAEFIY